MKETMDSIAARADDCMGRGDWDGAERVFLAALAEAEETGDRRAALSLCSELMGFYRQRGGAGKFYPVFDRGIDLAVTYVNLAQHYAAQNDTDARIAACLDKAMERMDSPDAVWEYYYAHTARKIAPALEALGRADAARDLRERADIIYEGT